MFNPIIFGLEVDGIELHRRLNRKIARLLAPPNAID
jgi:hypothetical protein